MKSMTCKQLGGACDLVFQAETFEEMVAQSKAHGTEMFKIQDPAHMKVMSEMRELMKTPEDMQRYFAEKQATFDALPTD